MAMTLRLDAHDQKALRVRAAAEGISMQDAARRAIRDYIACSEHRSRVSAASALILDVHADAIERLGWLATAVFSEINGASVAAVTNDDVYELVMAIAAADSTIEDIAAQLEQLHGSGA